MATDRKFVINPKTKRNILVGTKFYKRLIREGTIKPDQPPAPIETPRLDPPKAEIPTEAMVEMSAQIINENKSKLGNVKDKSDDDLDKLFRKLLIEKLTSSKVKAKKAKTKKAKKTKKKPIVLTSSDEDSSEESSSESD